jgi:tetrahydromethanopterin S-methyltransferase subunit D
MGLLKKSLLLLFSVAITVMAFAQTDKVEMADVMRSNGKIYIVVAVCLTILIGLFIYVYNIDRKVSRLEKQQHIL